jgi:dipeptidyl aminopeptidase/acylaminoacyl peptidase
MEDRIRERLLDLVEDAPTGRSLPTAVRRRARRRVGVTLTVGAVGIAVLTFGVSEGLRAVARWEVRPAQQPGISAFERARGWIAIGGPGIVAVDPSDPSNRVVLTRGPDTFDRPLVWSPDGSMLLFVRNPVTDRSFPEGDLFALHDDGREVQLTTGGGVIGGSFSPDGTEVVFAQITGFRENEAMDSLFVVPTDGGTPQRIEDGGEEPAFSYPAWSPDGQQVFYFGRFRDGADDAPGLGRTNGDGTGDGFLVDDLLLPEVEDGTAGLSWSPDGTRLAFAGTSETGHSAVYLIDADGTDLREVVGGDDVRYAWPTWSPDGSRLAFVSGFRIGPEGHAFTINVDGTDLRELAGVPADGRIAWNPAA